MRLLVPALAQRALVHLAAASDDPPLAIEPARLPAAGFLDEHGALATGLLFYATSFALLTLWDAAAVPALKRRGVLPDVPAPGELAEAAKAERWVTPLTAISSVPPPTLGDLERRGRHVVGRSPDALQCIYRPRRDVRTTPGVDEPSAEWSAYYDAPIRIRKTPRV